MASALSPGGYVRHGQRNPAPPRSVNVQVAVRCRPINDREKSHGERPILICAEGRREVQFSGPSALRKTNATAAQTGAHPSNGKKTYTYDQVYGPHATQADVYEGLVEPIVDEVLQGYNCTVFAYGQTGTGKTHTMEGRRDEHMVEVAERRLATNAGIIPRAVKQVFDYLRSLTDEHSVRVSHLELYNEQLSDLLGAADISSESLRVYEDAQKGTFVQGLEDVVVRSEDEIFAVLDRSATRRKTAETLMNKYSSRSHSIFSITIHIKESTPEGADLLKVGKLNLVDLAGSENIGRSGAVKGRAREAGNINQSLLTLGRVITALVDRHPHVPYRDSKLTRLLQESLGGRNKTCIIATVTPGSSSFEETASTLDYAYRAKSIKNRPTVNQMIAKHVLLKEYTEELSKLKRELDANRAKNGVYLPPEEFERLQRIASQQRDEISQLSEQTIDNERKLDAMKEKLERTQEALARDQRILADTRKNLARVTGELHHTKNELEVKTQQKDENAMLVKNHVANERVLHSHGEKLQENLSLCVSDAEALHERVTVHGDLEKENIANLQVMKENVDNGIASISNVVKKHKADQENLVQRSAAGLNSLSNTFQSGFESMATHLEELSAKIYSDHEACLQQDDTSTLDLEKSVGERMSNVDKMVSAQSESIAGHDVSMQAVCNGMVESFTKIQEAWSLARDAIDDFGSTHMTQFQALEQEQKTLLAVLHEDVSKGVSRQANLLNTLKSFNQKESEKEIDAVKSVKTQIIDSVTSSIDVLIQDTLKRVSSRDEHVQSYAAELHKESCNFNENVLKLQTMHASRFDLAKVDLKKRADDLTAKLDEQSSLQENSRQDGASHIQSIRNGSSGMVSLSRKTQETVAAGLKMASSLVSNHRGQSRERRNAQRQQLQSRVADGRDEVSRTREGVKESVTKSQVQMMTSLESIESGAKKSESDIINGLASDVHSHIEGYDLVCDSGRDKTPARREWPVPEQLPRTRDHGEIIAEMRKSRGSRDVPVENFEHLETKSLSLETRSDHDNDSLVNSATMEDEESMEHDADTASDGIISASRDTSPDRREEENREEVNDMMPSSESKENVRDGSQASILSDSTNKDISRNRSKLAHVIKKKPSAIPLPRTRTRGTRRKVGS